MGNSTEKKNGKKNKKGMKAGIIVIIAILLCIGVVAALHLTGVMELPFLSGADDGKVISGVSYLGTDLSGKTEEEAKAVISQLIEDYHPSITVTAEGKEFTLTAEDMGIVPDAEAEAAKVLAIGRGDDAAKNKEDRNTAKENGISISPDVDDTKLTAALTEKAKEINVEMKNASVKVNTTKSESNLTCSGTLEYTQPVKGVQLDVETTAALVKEALAKDGKDPVAAVVNYVEPEIGKLNTDLVLLGTYTTEFKSSSYNRRYNIWKMGTIVNGVVIEPGETWSINEEAGPRTTSRGWKEAGGIRNGVTVQEAGGGICQLSGTLYNAILCADIPYEDLDRSHHSWPSTYVPVGLDATISTGSPDFKVTNTSDMPIAFIVKCNGNSSKTVTIEVYGKPMEHNYKVYCTSNIVSRWSSDAAPIVVEKDPSLPAGTTVVLEKAKEGKKVDVYRIYEDKSTGKVVKKVKLYTDTYKASPDRVKIGTGASASPAPTKTPEPTETAKPTTKPTETPKPTIKPTESSIAGE